MKDAEKQIHKVDETVSETGLWVTRLEHERYRQFAAMQVCDRRIELRKECCDGKPQDSLQEALEAELKLLGQVRLDLMKMEDLVKGVIMDLKRTRYDLSKDAARRRLEVEADRARLVTVALAGAQAPGTRQLESVEAFSAVMPEEDTATLCQRSLQFQDKAAELRRLSQDKVREVKAKCARANFRTNERLTKSTEHNLEVTRSLIDQGKEVDYTIDMARRSLAAQRKNIHNKKQEDEFQTAQNMLEELRQAKQDLTEQLRQKTVLLNISENCRKVTPVRCSVKPRPSTAPGEIRGSKSRKLPAIANGDLTRFAEEGDNSTHGIIAPSASPESVDIV
jgi:hypothetical protein